MAKPDWGALQDQFLAEHAKSGISPKDWCEAQSMGTTLAELMQAMRNADQLAVNN